MGEGRSYKCYDFGLMVGKAIVVEDRVYFFRPICIRSWESLVDMIKLGDLTYQSFEELDEEDLKVLHNNFVKELEA